MNILQAFLVYGNKTEPWSFNLIKELANRNHNIDVAATNYLDSEFYDDRFYYHRNKIIDNLSVGKIKRGFSKYYYPSWLLKKLANRKLDLIHTHFGPAGWRYKSIAQKYNIPLVISFYGKDYEYIPYNQPEWESRYQKLFKIADLFVCEGEHGKKILIEKGCPKEKVEVVHLGIHPEDIQFVNRSKKPNELKIVQVAYFNKKKGQIDAVKAFHKSLSDGANMSLTFVGKKTEGFAAVNRYIGNNNLQDKVKHIPFVKYAELYDFLSNFHVFIHPSHYSSKKDCEGGAPVVLLDAQSTGLPVIATTHCDIPDSVIHDETGLLTPERDICALSRSINRFYKMNQEEYDDFCTKGRRHIEQEFDVKRSADKLIKLYKEVVSRYSHYN